MCPPSNATSTDVKRRRRIKGLIRRTGSPDQPIDRPPRHSVTMAIIGTPREAKRRGVKGRFAIFLPFTGQREDRGRKRWGGKGRGHKDMRRPSLKSVYKAKISPFASSQSLWAISTCNNPPLLLLCLSGHPHIKLQDLSVRVSFCLSVCLSVCPSVFIFTDKSNASVTFCLFQLEDDHHKHHSEINLN